MICPNCGNELNDDSVSCENCGAEFSDVQPKKSKVIKIIISIVAIALTAILLALFFTIQYKDRVIEETTISTTEHVNQTNTYEYIVSDEFQVTTESDEKINKEITSAEEQTISNDAYISDKCIELYLEGSEGWENVALCNMKNIDADVYWDIDNVSIASIVPDGNIVDVYAKAPGETVLTCRCAGKIFSCKVIVYASYYDLEDDYEDDYYDENDYDYEYTDNSYNDNNNSSGNSSLAAKYMEQIDELNESIRREERKLSILQMDTSGLYASEIAAQKNKLEKLYKQREELYQKYYDALY